RIIELEREFRAFSLPQTCRIGRQRQRRRRSRGIGRRRRCDLRGHVGGRVRVCPGRGQDVRGRDRHLWGRQNGDVGVQARGTISNASQQGLSSGIQIGGGDGDVGWCRVDGSGHVVRGRVG